jgi:hypothetical protein
VRDDVTATDLLAGFLAFVIGYGAQRGGLCVVTGVEQIIDRRSARLLLAFLRASVWSLVATVAIFWLVPLAHFSPTYAVTGVTLAGGFIFGIGAAINWGCAFGTITRLGTGDLSFAFTLAGVAVGIGAVDRVAGVELGRQLGPTLLATPSTIGATVVIASAFFCTREAFTRRTWPVGGGWPPEGSAMLIGATGGALYALTGSWSYTLLLHRLPAHGGAGPADLSIPFLIPSAALVGATAAAVVAKEFRLHLSASSLPRRLIGGTLMGVGAALVPGGNGVLVLQGMPALSPHAGPAYLAVVGGVAVAILALRKGASRRAISSGDR